MVLYNNEHSHDNFIYDIWRTVHGGQRGKEKSVYSPLLDMPESLLNLSGKVDEFANFDSVTYVPPK